jgi:hypothetical protein
MTFLVWADGEPEENGQPIDAEIAEDAVTAYMVAAIRRGKGFEELVFFVKDDEWVQRVRVRTAFSARLVRPAYTT